MTRGESSTTQIKSMRKLRRPITNHDRYLIWATTRSILETENHKHKPEGEKLSYRSLFLWLVYRFADLLRILNLYKIGIKNARNIQLKREKIVLPNLPSNFNNYRILHISDMHIDSLENFELDIITALPKEEIDLCIISGDFRSEDHGEYVQLLPKIRKVVDNLNTKDGTYAVLGNHDPFQLTEHEEDLNCTFLVNESEQIKRGSQTITLTGTDDPYRYYTDQAAEAISEPNQGFKIAMVHTAELANIASLHNYSLYFCGHTHGGQVCLPGGTAIITHQTLDPRLSKGIWKIGTMTGHTSVGCGVSGIPVRFFCKPEITLFQLETETSAVKSDEVK